MSGRDDFRSSISESIRAVARWRIRHQLTAHQAETCLLVSETGAISAADLSREVGITTASMSRLLAQLEQAGWITREPDARDARRQIVRPSQRLEEAMQGAHGLAPA